MKRNVLVAALAVALTVTACSSEAPAPTASTTVAESAEAEAIPESGPLAADSLAGSMNEQLGIVVGPKETDKHGTYNQAVLSEDSELLTDNDFPYTAEPGSVTDDAAFPGYLAAVRLLIEHGIDSPLMHDDTTSARHTWTETVLPSFEPDVRKEAAESVDAGRYFAGMTNSGMWMEQQGVVPAPYDGVRFSVIAFDTVSVEPGSDPADIVVEFRYAIARPLARDGNPMINVTWASRAYRVTDKDGWKLGGWMVDENSWSMTSGEYDAYIADGTLPDGIDFDPEELDAFANAV